MVRVRFAPSPTGNLHIGSARTALFNWLYARSQGGKFILRIEDTDKERSKDVFLKEILSSLEWLGLNWDEGPYYQSQREEIYRTHAEELVKTGIAYREGEAIIFKVPQEKIKIYDIIHGEIEVDNSLIKDIVLIKSDKTATYNFACVIDDSLMAMTHIIRGDDHISNTNKQIVLYNALGLKLPKFAHIPLILAPDKSRLSKRFGATSITEYREKGYLRQGLVNYLSLLGWAPGDNKEFMDIDTIIKKFSLKRINKRGAEFNEDKLRWINGEHIRSLEFNKFAQISKDFIKEEVDDVWFSSFVKLYHGRVKTLLELKEEMSIFKKDDIEYDKEAFENYLNKEGVKDILNAVKDILSKVDDFTVEKIESPLREYIKEKDIKGADLIHPLRVAVTGKSVSAGVFEVIVLLGKERTIKRLEKFLNS